MVGCSSAIASITASVAQLRAQNRDKQIKCELLRRYMDENRISDSCRMEVFSHVRTASKNLQRLLHESDVELLADMPNTLQKKVRTEVYSCYFDREDAHPVFAHTYAQRKHRQLCNVGMN